MKKSARPPAANAGNGISIIIKCLNEEARIEKAIISCLKALEGLAGEVIVADALSQDSTVAIASGYPVKIVQLLEKSDRSCGAGPQLGYQYSQGEFIYILDADMVLHRDFLLAALEHMAAFPDTAGVGGLVNEKNTQSLEYIARVARNAGHMAVGEVDRLDMGGLYRRRAIESVGYFSNRNLHSYEELELAVRLRVAGWTLQRLPVVSVDHYGHDKNPYSLLKSRWNTRYIDGSGEIIMGSLGRPWCGLLLASLKEARLYACLVLWTFASILMLCILLLQGCDVAAAAAITAGVYLFLPFSFYLFKKKSLSAALYACVSLAANTGGMLRGMVRSGSLQETRVPGVVVKVV